MIFLFLVFSCIRESVVEKNEIARIYANIHDNKYILKEEKVDESSPLFSTLKISCPKIEKEVRIVELSAEDSKLTLYLPIEKDEALCISFDVFKGPEIINKTPQDNITLLLVNNQGITINDFKARAEYYAMLDINISSEQILNDLIDNALLMQEAKDIEIKDIDVMQTISKIYTSANLTEEEFMSILNENNVSFEDYKKSVINNLKIQKLLDKKLFLEQTKTDENLLKEYYQTNIQTFAQEPQAYIRHIFIAVDENKSEEEASKIAIEVLEKLNTGADFCELNRIYTDDKESIESCGEYVVPKGVMEEKLDNIVFNKDLNKPMIVKVSEGYQIVEVLSRSDSFTPFEIVKPQIEQYLTQQMITQKLNIYLAYLRSKAKIIIFLV